LKDAAAERDLIELRARSYAQAQSQYQFSHGAMKLRGNHAGRYTSEYVAIDSVQQHCNADLNGVVVREGEFVLPGGLGRQRLKFNSRLRLVSHRLSHTHERGHCVKQPPHTAGRHAVEIGLQLAQQDLAQLQARFDEGKAGLREVEKARLDENEKWMALLDATFERQQAQLDLLKTAGQLDKVLQ